MVSYMKHGFLHAVHEALHGHKQLLAYDHAVQVYMHVMIMLVLLLVLRAFQLNSVCHNIVQQDLTVLLEHCLPTWPCKHSALNYSECNPQLSHQRHRYNFYLSCRMTHIHDPPLPHTTHHAHDSSATNSFIINHNEIMDGIHWVLEKFHMEIRKY